MDMHEQQVSRRGPDQQDGLIADAVAPRCEQRGQRLQLRDAR